MAKNFAFHAFDTKIVCKTVLLIFLFICLDSRARAQGWEYYGEFKVKVSVNKNNNIYLNLKEETRYKEGINYYRKSFFGLSKKVNPVFEYAFYCAFKEKKAEDWKNLYLFWLEIIYRVNTKKVTWESSTKLERHTSQHLWKFREKARLFLPVSNKVNLWIGDEFRYFFKGCELGENEVLAGLQTNVTKCLSFNIFYDRRSIKIEGNWQNTGCLRISFDIKP